MDVIEAMQARHSVRDFSPEPVAKDTIMKILEAANYSPSGANGQPWEVFVVTGAPLENIRKIYLERSKAGPVGPPRKMPPRPDYIEERFTVIRRERLELLGLDPDDPASGKVFSEWSSRLFGAPVLVVLCMDKALSNNLDIGIYIQSICLAAQDYGVDSFIAGSFCQHQDVLRQEHEIPEDLNIVTGVGLGYPNPDAIINTYRSPRRPVQEVIRYKD